MNSPTVAYIHRLLHRFQPKSWRKKRQDFSAFALTYILRLSSCRVMGDFVISPLPRLLTKELCAAGPLCSTGVAPGPARVLWTPTEARQCAWRRPWGKRRRRKFTGEFKKEAVRLFKAGERSIGQVAKELDLTESALRNWVKQYKVGHGEGPREALTTAERDELGSLRRRVRTLEQEREILKKAAAFFAKESE